MRRLATLALLASAPLAAARAQDASFTPWIGAFLPVTANAPVALGEIRRPVTWAVGGRVGVVTSRTLGFELSIGYSPAPVRLRGDILNRTQNTNFVFSSLKALFELTPDNQGLRLQAGLGPAIIRRSSTALQETAKGTDVGGVLSLGASYPLRGSIRLRVDAENFVYSGNYGAGRKFQNDLVVSLGVGIGFGGRDE